MRTVNATTAEHLPRIIRENMRAGWYVLTWPASDGATMRAKIYGKWAQIIERAEHAGAPGWRTSGRDGNTSAAKLADSDADEWADNASEFADGATDVYNGRLLQWVASHLDRVSYCDEAIDEGVCDPSKGLIHILQCGQFREIEFIYSALAAAIESHADDNPCAWIAGSNMPGYVPDETPAGFDTFEDACASIAEDMERDADALESARPAKPFDTAELRDAEELRERALELRDAASKLREYFEREAYEWGATIAGRHYFVSRGA